MGLNGGNVDVDISLVVVIMCMPYIGARQFGPLMCIDHGRHHSGCKEVTFDPIIYTCSVRNHVDTHVGGSIIKIDKKNDSLGQFESGNGIYCEYSSRILLTSTRGFLCRFFEMVRRSPVSKKSNLKQLHSHTDIPTNKGLKHPRNLKSRSNTLRRKHHGEKTPRAPSMRSANGKVKSKKWSELMEKANSNNQQSKTNPHHLSNGIMENRANQKLLNQSKFPDIGAKYARSLRHLTSHKNNRNGLVSSQRRNRGTVNTPSNRAPMNMNQNGQRWSPGNSVKRNQNGQRWSPGNYQQNSRSNWNRNSGNSLNSFFNQPVNNRGKTSFNAPSGGQVMPYHFHKGLGNRKPPKSRYSFNEAATREHRQKHEVTF